METGFPSTVLNVMPTKSTLHMQLQEGQHSAEQVKLDATPVVRIPGPRICMFEGPAEKFENKKHLLEVIAAKTTYEIKLNLAVTTCCLQHLLGSGCCFGNRIDSCARQVLGCLQFCKLQAQLWALGSHIPPGPGELTCRVTTGRALKTVQYPQSHYINPTEHH